VLWDLDDLAGVGELAAFFGVSRATPVNWAARYDDFPEPLKVMAAGPLYSRVQVVAWTRRKWPGGLPVRGRARGVPQPRR